MCVCLCVCSKNWTTRWPNKDFYSCEKILTDENDFSRDKWIGAYYNLKSLWISLYSNRRLNYTYFYQGKIRLNCVNLGLCLVCMLIKILVFKGFPICCLLVCVGVEMLTTCYLPPPHPLFYSHCISFQRILVNWRKCWKIKTKTKHIVKQQIQFYIFNKIQNFEQISR